MYELMADERVETKCYESRAYTGSEEVRTSTTTCIQRALSTYIRPAQTSPTITVTARYSYKVSYRSCRIRVRVRVSARAKARAGASR